MSLLKTIILSVLAIIILHMTYTFLKHKFMEEDDEFIADVRYDDEVVDDLNKLNEISNEKDLDEKKKKKMEEELTELLETEIKSE